MDLEKPIEKAILEWLNLQPDVFAFKINRTGIYDDRRKCWRKPPKWHNSEGVADILACVDLNGIGLFCAFEVKSAKGFQTEDQMTFGWNVKMRRGFYFVVRSIQDAAKALEAIKYITSERKQQHL